ncbi:MAG: DUF5696 domain-containing protein [Acholeplasmataceae bacterium]
MVKHVMKYAVILVIVSMLSMLIVHANQIDQSYSQSSQIDNYSYINNLLFESSRYTQLDENDQAVLDTYHDDFQVDYTLSDLALLGYEQIFDTDQLRVYFEKDSFSLVIINKVTGYTWSSRPEFQGISGTREDNTATRNLMNSGLWIEYVRAANVSSATINNASLYTIADVSYQNDGSITAENNDTLRPYYIEDGSYDYQAVETTIKSQTQDALTLGVNFKTLKITFDVTIEMVDNQLTFDIPHDSIKESGDVYRLMSIQLLPYLGAAREDKIPGYMVIPDGVGALVRLNQAYDTYFQARYFGSDEGYQAETVAELTLPIYGMVHEADQNGYYATILEGSENSTLFARFWGSNSRYQRIGNKFNVRQIYQYVINKAGDGNDAIYEDMVTTDYKIAFNFLSDDQANYTGIASSYRDALIEEGVLSAREATTNDQIPIHLSYIMSDQEPTFIGSKTVTMSTPDQVREMYQTFYDAGITNQQTTIMGWSKDGFIYENPYRTRIKSKSDYEDLIAYMLSNQNQVYFEDDYVTSSEKASRITYNGDVAKDLSRLKMVFNNRSLNGQVTEVYFLYPSSSYHFASQDQSFFNDLGVSGLTFNNMGRILFSYYDGQKYDRDSSIEFYQQIANLYDQNLISVPNIYLYAYMTGYLDMPITNAQYSYYTDLVPLIPIVLKGSVSYYTEYLNFNALQDDRLLMMVDFAVNPNYVLTYEETYKMRYTGASVYYTTTFANYEDNIISTYQYLNDALSDVISAKIVKREVLDTGFVKVTYDNGVMIYINYTYETLSDGSVTVGQRSYEVIK